MDHADVTTWLDEAFFTPAAPDGEDERARAVRDHLATCAGCAAHAASLRRTALKLDFAFGPSPQARVRVLHAVRSVGRARQSAPVGVPWWRTATGLRLAAAVLVIGVIGVAVGALWGLARPPSGEAQQLTRVVSMMSELAGQPSTHEMVLRDAAGNAAGMALMSVESNQLAVFTSALTKPVLGSYSCYLERDSQRTRIGPMLFTEGISFWGGQVADSLEMRPGDQLVVAADSSAPAMLSASF